MGGRSSAAISASFMFSGVATLTPVSMAFEWLLGGIA